eukprot:13538091-Alexandrium_andersonii.AAC.1
MGPELAQRAVAELLTPDRVASATALQPALLRLKEQLRGIESPGSLLEDPQRAIGPLRRGGLSPQPLLDRPENIENAFNTLELELKRVERQVERDHLRTLTYKSHARGASTKWPPRRGSIAPT